MIRFAVVAMSYLRQVSHTLSVTDFLGPRSRKRPQQITHPWFDQYLPLLSRLFGMYHLHFVAQKPIGC